MKAFAGTLLVGWTCGVGSGVLSAQGAEPFATGAEVTNVIASVTAETGVVEFEPVAGAVRNVRLEFSDLVGAAERGRSPSAAKTG